MQRLLRVRAIAVAVALVVAPSVVVAQSAVAVPAAGVIDINVGRGQVEVRGWDRAELSLEGNREGHEVIRTGSGAQVRRSRGRSGDGALRIMVPRASRVLLHGSSNDIDVRDIEGDVEVRINNGDVTMEAIAGRIRISSITGDVELTGAARGAHVVTTSGDITMRDVRGDVHVTTTGGDIALVGAQAGTLTLETMNGDVQFSGSLEEVGRSSISTHSGDVLLQLRADARAMIETRSFSGRVNSQFPLVLQPTSQNSGDAVHRLQLGRTGGPTLAIATFSGDIDIVRIDARDNN